MAERNNPVSWRKIALFSAGVGLLFVASIGAFFFFGDSEKTLDIAGRISPIYLAGLTALTFLSILLRVKRWDYFSREISGKTRTTLFGKAKALLVGIAAGLVTPAKSGELTRVLIYKKTENIPSAKAMLLLFYERVFDFLFVTTFALAFLSRFGEGRLSLAVPAIGLAGAIVLITGLLFIRKTRRAILSRAFRKTFRTEGDLTEGDKLFSPKGVPGALAYSGAIWALEFSRISLIFSLITGSIQNPFLIAQAFSLSIIIGVISAIPGGIGAVELSSTAIYGAIGISGTEAVAAVLIDRVVAFWPVVLAGLVFFPKVLLTGQRK